MRRFIKFFMVGTIAATLIVPVYTTAAKVTKSTGKDAAAMLPAVEMFPNSIYDNTSQIPGATGKVNMIQPNGNVDVILAVSADGLAPLTTYKVWFDTDGIVPGEEGNPGPDDYPPSAGPWELKGSFTTDDYGYGEWNYTAPAGTHAVGTYSYSVFVNCPGTFPTVLVSYNVEFEIVSD